jgi:DNA modification methylase
MPSLSWPGKVLAAPVPGSLFVDSVIYPAGRGYPSADPQDRLIWGDNLQVMAALLPEFEGRVDLIYADPPFFSNRAYQARVGRNEDSRKPQGWRMASGYPDAWPNLEAYLDFLYPRLALMHRLLSPHGTLYLHLDWHADAYARLLLDEIFGPERFLNEVIWTYHGPSPVRRAFNRKHDTILVYVKGPQYTFNADSVRMAYNPATLATFKSSRKAGFGKMPDLARGKVPEDWWYFPVVARLHGERTGYPTQKPAALLERLIRASSNPGETVADFFCGSGTAPAVAAVLGRRFLACDVTWRAVHASRSRLALACPEPFLLEGTQPASAKAVVSKVPNVGLKATRTTVRLERIREVDYWEVDPAWDGKTFKSAAQAQRAYRSGEIAQEFRIKTGRRLCVRLVTVDGERFQLDV